jgi:transposase
VPTPGQNVKRTLFGALNARTGQVVWMPRPRKRATDFVAFLDHLARAYPVGELVLVLDNVITHDAKLVRQWLADPAQARFRVLWLPKYSAHEHNPIERIWGLLKDAVAANRLHGSIDELVAAAERFFATTTFPPSRTRRHRRGGSGGGRLKTTPYFCSRAKWSIPQVRHGNCGRPSETSESGRPERWR